MEVRKVERPEGTIVYAYGKNGDRYGVKRREFVEVDGKVVQKDGLTIGHIIDLKYVPIDESNQQELMERMDAYIDEFEAHGTENITIEH